MSKFVTALDAREVDEFEGIWQLLAPLVYESDLVGLVVVPTDFCTDFASVPRLPFAYMVVGGKGNRAAVVHDWLYSGGLPIGRLEALTRAQADDVFAEALAACGYGRVVRGLMYAGVRVGGASRFAGPNLPQPPHVEAAMDVNIA